MSVGADDVNVLLSQFEGWTIEKAAVSPAPNPTNVIYLRAPNGRTSWVALCGAFDLGLTAYELKAGHRLLTRIEFAEQLAADRARANRLAARRAILAESTGDSDDCPPFGMLRPPLEVR